MNGIVHLATYMTHKELQMTVTVKEIQGAEAIVVAKTPSKKSMALTIFQSKLADLKAKKFTSNKDFRAAVLETIKLDLGVSTASAATMYNAAKKDAEAADVEVKLGRDPKKERVKSENAKRGRPSGSKNKAKEKEVQTIVVDTVTSPTETAETADPVA